MKQKTQLYQGDVPILKVDSADGVRFKALPPEGVVVAEGEVTGHRHRVVTDTPQKVFIARDERGFYLKVEEGGLATVVHEEHAPVEMGVGIYFIGEQQEYDELEEYRKVQD